MKSKRETGAVYARYVYLGICLVLVTSGLLLSGCAAPERGAAPVLYDFGDRPLPSQAAQSGTALPSLATSVQATAALDGSAMLYRLAYSDEKQLRAYALARWAMPPAELVQQRLREVLSQQRAVLKPGEGAQWLLQVELDEFSQVFESPGQSNGLVRLRATVLKASPAGDRVLAQRSLRVQRPASSGGAAGGVRALSAATDAAVDELAQWLLALR
jgi:cholesterol transport system auxiliary component